MNEVGWTLIPRSKFKNLLTRAYYSKRISIFYIILIILCLIDLIVACIYIRSYQDELWVLILDISLNLIMTIDSCLRIYMKGCSSFNWKANRIEFLVIIFSMPEIGLVFLYTFLDKGFYFELEIISIVLTGLVILIRPFIIFFFHRKTKITSIFLPISVLTEADVVRCSAKQRMDSQCDDRTSIYTANSNMQIK